jgi:CRISPR type I-A-associated protein Csa5
MITLQTPGTGFDDFESRIALGLCRVALDCIEPNKLTLEESFDRYLIHIDMDEARKDDLAKSLSLWCLRLLSDEGFLGQNIGVRPRWRQQQAMGVATFGMAAQKGQAFQDIFQKYEGVTQRTRKGSQDSSCGHEYPKEEKIFGALEEVFSPQLGQPPKRDNITNQKTLDLCPSCGVLGLLGTASFQLIISLRRRGTTVMEKYFMMPRFRGEVNGESLLSYIATVKHIRPSLYDVPSNSAVLALLSYYPHLSRVIQITVGQYPTFFVSRADTSGNVRRYEHFEEKKVEDEIRFLGNKDFGSYNVALAQKAYRFTEDKPELLGLLSKTLQLKQPQDAISFYREYASVTEGKLLVYNESTLYVLKEVLKMEESLIDDPNIGAMAAMLRYFVRDRKYGYVDNLRSSRSPEEFEKYILSALRDAASIHSKPEDTKTPDEKRLRLPNEANIREFLRLLQGGKFEDVKTLVCLLAFSYWKKEEEK